VRGSLTIDRVAVSAGLAAVAAAPTLLFWPLNEPGVTGSAAAPHYRAFGWESYRPLPEHPSLDDFRRAGIPVPQDAVHRRKVEAGGTAAVGLAGLAFLPLSRRRSRRRGVGG
jgi:hypothetical protein